VHGNGKWLEDLWVFSYPEVDPSGTSGQPSDSGNVQQSQRVFVSAQQECSRSAGGGSAALPYRVNDEDWPQANRSRKVSESEFVVTWCRNVLWHQA